ncbi:MAG: hypothetical protein ACT4QE_11250 [Anaerolineales bacterium]
MTTLTGQIILAAKKLRRTLKLSPIQFVFRRLREHGVRLDQLTALEAFGGTGVNQTPDLYAAVKQLEIWDLNPARRALLQQNFPKARVVTGDSYLMIRQVATTHDMVVLDSAARMGERYEYFEMFPHVFRVFNDPGILIVNEVPIIRDTDPERLRQREAFYQTGHPEYVTWDQIKVMHRRMAAEYGWAIDHFFTERRWQFNFRQDPVYYTVLMLRRL